MTKLRWPEVLFIVCFLLIVVGGSWWWRPQAWGEALVVLVVATAVAAGVWLAILFAVTRRAKGDPPAPDAAEKSSRSRD